MVLFVLQNNSFDKIGRLIVPCLEYCAARGLPFADRSLTSDLDLETWVLDDAEGMVVYGSVGWMKRFKASRYGRWIDYDEDAFAATTWVPALGSAAFNAHGAELSVSDVTGRLSGSGTSLHVRPNRDDKAFAGGVFDATSWEKMISEMGALTGMDMTEVTCWASEVRKIDAEIRCWFVEGELVEASYYRRCGSMYLERITDAAILGRIASLGCLYLPCGNCVLDVALSEGGMTVLEFNPIHSSGWYAADVTRVLDAWTASFSPSMRIGLAPIRRN